MSQQSRKDPRAKVLSMTVRYKSATLADFIEHHSHDVSRGGMYIKTPQPFPAGTLLKFEVRIAGDEKVIQGVGRVVWKRDSAGPDPDKPAGMGIKFIKLDDASREVIEQLMGQKGDVPSTFDEGVRAPGATSEGSERPTEGEPSAPVPSPTSPDLATAAPSSRTILGTGPGEAEADASHALVSAQRTSLSQKPSASASQPVSSRDSVGTTVTKGASMAARAPSSVSGPSSSVTQKSERLASLPVGPSLSPSTPSPARGTALSSPPPATAPKPATAAPKPAGVTPPSSKSDAPIIPMMDEGDVEDGTVMKQATELLEAALMSAGGTREGMRSEPPSGVPPDTTRPGRPSAKQRAAEPAESEAVGAQGDSAAHGHASPIEKPSPPSSAERSVSRASQVEERSVRPVSPAPKSSGRSRAPIMLVLVLGAAGALYYVTRPRPIPPPVEGELAVQQPADVATPALTAASAPSVEAASLFPSTERSATALASAASADAPPAASVTTTPEPSAPQSALPVTVAAPTTPDAPPPVRRTPRRPKTPEVVLEPSEPTPTEPTVAASPALTPSSAPAATAPAATAPAATAPAATAPAVTPPAPAATPPAPAATPPAPAAAPAPNPASTPDPA